MPRLYNEYIRKRIMSKDVTGFIKYPSSKPSPSFYILYENLKRITRTVPKNVKNGLQTGIIFSLVLPFLVKQPNGSGFLLFILGLFLIGTLLGIFFTAIFESMKKFSKYSRGQQTGIAIGFILLFITLIALLIFLDVKLFNNSIYQILLSLYLYSSTFLATLPRKIPELFNSWLDTISNFLPKPTAENISEIASKNQYMLLASLAICIILFFAAREPRALSTYLNQYAIVMFIPFLIGFIILSPLLQKKDSSQLLMFGGAIMALIIAVCVYYANSISPDIVALMNSVMGWVGLLIFIIGMALVVKLFSNDLKQMTGWSGFFANLFFYIPCLLNDLLDYIFVQFNTTPNTVLLLFVTEILLILFYIYYPMILNKLIAKNENILQKSPAILSQKLVIANSEKMLMAIPKYDKNSDNEKRYNTNYTFDMWIHLNIQPSSTSAYANETTIFDFGNGKPRIAYKNSVNNSRIENEDNYLIYISNTNNQEPITVSVPNQKWNYFAINFMDSKVDIYINGSLERTVKYTDNIPSYHSSDSVTIGSENGLDGSICNINYYTIPLTSTQIATKYNVLSLKNPPI